MQVAELLQIYRTDSGTAQIREALRTRPSFRLGLENVLPSSECVLLASLWQADMPLQVIVRNDPEEAWYAQNDLKAFLPNAEVLIFPSSYKKPYQFEAIENANVLLRTEALSRIQESSEGIILVTYPQAIPELVLSKKTLTRNSFQIKVGEGLDMAFLEQFLMEYHFERTEFVYEPGQYAIRGGILDVFSFAHEFPFRIELFGTEVERIRSFHPETQLSVETKTHCAIIPNVQSHLELAVRESLWDFLPKDTTWWYRDIELVEETVSKIHTAYADYYEAQSEGVSAAVSLTEPSKWVLTLETFQQHLNQSRNFESGRAASRLADRITFHFKSQPSFHKDFSLLLADLQGHQDQDYTIVLASDLPRQLDRMRGILEELNPTLRYQEMVLNLSAGFIDTENRLLVYTDHQVFERFHRFKAREKYSKSKAITLKELQSLKPGDYVVHADHGVARFAGLEKIEINGNLQEAIRLVFRDDDMMRVSIHALHKISRYTGKEGATPQVTKLGSGDWEQKKNKVRRQVKDIAKDLIALYAKRKAAPGFMFSQDSFLQAELETSFIYEDTPDQAKATQDVKLDMEKPHPMDRLVCGDVGFGKTEVAIRAAFKAVCDGKQVAILVPTTILAMQHYKTFRDRLSAFPLQVESVSRFRTTTQIKETLKRVAEGKTQILIGTHRIIGKDVLFKDLGLLVIDEEQKFGVKVKEKLKEFRVNVDTLTLTATPIPRTLHFSLMGARDLSVIATPPPNRQPVTTEVHAFNESVIRDAIMEELQRGGQVFFVHNRVKDIESIANTILRLIPDARIGIAHGQMEGDDLEKVMMKFVEGEYDILVSTNIIESGLDIPNANTIIINSAHMFGLSELHQMRGRVGRSNKKAYCILLTPPLSTLSTDSRKRLGALEEFSDLGDGFKVAMRDLDIRGAGNLLGAEQSGFITDIGFDMYHKILDEAIAELKETEFADLFRDELDAQKLKSLISDCTLETDLSVLIPDTYVSNISERLSLYTALDNLKEEAELAVFRSNLQDRFGPIPAEVENLMEAVRLRWMGEQLGFEKLTLKGDVLKAQFPPQEKEHYYQSELFGRILAWVQQNPRKCKIKEISKKLYFQQELVFSLEQAMKLLSELIEGVAEEVK